MVNFILDFMFPCRKKITEMEAMRKRGIETIEKACRTIDKENNISCFFSTHGGKKSVKNK